MKDVVLRVEDLCKNYKSKNGDVVANNHISFELQKGEILAVLGPNGAGKSTLIKQIIGYVASDSGTIEINGSNVKDLQKNSLNELGYMMQSRFEHWDHLSVYDAIYYSARLKKLPKSEIHKEIDYLTERLQIKEELHKPLKFLSGGKKQATALACAVVGKPSILILDEPTTGLDPEKRVVFWQFLEELKKDRKISILLITHNVTEIEKMVDRVIIVGQGKILKEGAPKELYKEYENQIRVEVKISKENMVLENQNELVRFFPKWGSDGKTLFLYTDEENLTRCIDTLFSIKSIKDNMENFQIIRPSLEDIYIRIMGEKIN